MTKKDWNLPPQQALFRPILEIAAKYPAGTTLQTVYEQCKPFFPHLTAADFALLTGETPENAWKLQIRSAKKKLEFECKYLLANGPRGHVHISNAGMQALTEMQAGTWTKPTSRKKVRQPT